MTVHNYLAVIPAAGTGVRMASALPKQYLPLVGKTVLEWAIDPFLQDDRCQAVVVVIASEDEHWPKLSLVHPKLQVTLGGAERAHSVLSGLSSLKTSSEYEWVLIHDAARPCLHADDLHKLCTETDDESIGSILAMRLADTLKRADREGCIESTVPRDHLWRALTPQLFRLGILKAALQSALAEGLPVTDESSALEHMSYHPKLIEGRSDNLKITVPSDLSIAENILSQRFSCS